MHRSLVPACIALFLGVLFMAGCGGSRAVVDERPERSEAFPNHSIEEIHEQLFVPSDTLESFQARASLQVQAPEQSGSFSAELRHKRNDSLYMAISPGFGVEAARMLVTPDSFYVYDRIRRELTYGSVEDGERVLPLPLESQELMPSFLGMLRPDADGRWELEADEEYYYLTSSDEQKQYTIDPGLWRVVHYELRSDDGEVIEERSYSEFDRIAGYYLPRRVELERPLDEMEASIYYREISLNPGELSFDLGVSSRARRVPASAAIE